MDTLAIWHEIVENRDTKTLSAILADDVVLISPVVHTPQRGKNITELYLNAALHVFNNNHFRYVREARDEQGVVMEFETEVDGVFVNGVDMVKWNKQGLITEFKVMIRPLQAVNIIHRKMGEMLQQLGG